MDSTFCNPLNERMEIGERSRYTECIAKQLVEVDLLTSIYCNPGEMQILDSSVISEFHDFIANPLAPPSTLSACLDFIIKISVSIGNEPNSKNDKIEIRVELPHLYPTLENAIISVYSNLLSKQEEIYIKDQILFYIDFLDKSETYIFEIITWLQDQISELKRDANKLDLCKSSKEEEQMVDFERLWIYSHHIKSKTKRQAIVHNGRNLNLSGFCRPGKPGVICVEGLKQNTQEFWKIIKAMHWQKITIRKSEVRQKSLGEIDKLRRFTDFKEDLCADNGEDENLTMNMANFMKFLEMHNSGYIKKDLFGIE